MRYVVDENNRVKAISFGTTMEYNDCVCVEYTGMVPSGWNSLEAWYFDEGNKLWRWQIIDGELTLDESAVAPEEGSWMGIVVSDPVMITTGSLVGNEIAFNLPDGTERLAGFFLVFAGDKTVDADDQQAKCISLYTSIDKNTTDITYLENPANTSRCGVAKTSMEGGFTLEENVVNINIGSAEAFDYLGVVFLENSQYALYPFYHR